MCSPKILQEEISTVDFVHLKCQTTVRNIQVEKGCTMIERKAKGTVHPFRLLSLPFYMCGQLKRLVQAVHAGDAPPIQP